MIKLWPYKFFSKVPEMDIGQIYLSRIFKTLPLDTSSNQSIEDNTFELSRKIKHEVKIFFISNSMIILSLINEAHYILPIIFWEWYKSCEFTF